jgi:hypothetical protein
MSVRGPETGQEGRCSYEVHRLSWCTAPAGSCCWVSRAEPAAVDRRAGPVPATRRPRHPKIAGAGARTVADGISWPPPELVTATRSCSPPLTSTTADPLPTTAAGGSRPVRSLAGAPASCSCSPTGGRRRARRDGLRSGASCAGGCLSQIEPAPGRASTLPDIWQIAHQQHSPLPARQGRISPKRVFIPNIENHAIHL